MVSAGFRHDRNTLRAQLDPYLNTFLERFDPLLITMTVRVEYIGRVSRLVTDINQGT